MKEINSDPETIHPKAAELNHNLTDAGYVVKYQVAIHPIELPPTLTFEEVESINLEDSTSGNVFTIECFNRYAKYFGMVCGSGVSLWRFPHARKVAQGLILPTYELSENGILRVGEQILMPYFRENESPVQLEIEGQTIRPIDITDLNARISEFGAKKKGTWLDRIARLHVATL